MLYIIRSLRETGEYKRKEEKLRLARKKGNGIATNLFKQESQVCQIDAEAVQLNKYSVRYI